MPAKRDYTAWAVALGATGLSVAAYVITVRLGGVLLYVDAVSHLEIARRVVVSTSPGLAQLGYVWLPLPHLLMLPLVWNTTLYHNGFAGSVVSMAAYVATAVLVYKITFRITDRKCAGVVAAGVFALNADMLYMQSTPMTEALLFCMLAATAYCIQQWAYTDQYWYLMEGGAAALLATLSRYESWPIVACLLVAVIVIAWQRGHALTPKLRRVRTGDRFIAFAIPAMAGIVAWVLWNWTIFGNPAYFQDGPYAKASLWLTRNEPAIGHWLIATKVYWYAMADNETWPILLLAAAGLICLAVLELRNMRSTARTLPVLSLLVMVPFFIVTIYTGQRPLHVLQINHDLYDVRFGLIMLVPTAILTGYLVGSLRHFRYAMHAAGVLVVMLAAALSVIQLRQHDVVSYNEPRFSLNSVQQHDQDRVVAFLRGHYRGGRLLMESHGNEIIAFAVPSSQVIYEGSYRQWLPALHNPAGSHIQWIIARCNERDVNGVVVNTRDKVCRSVTRAELTSYALVYETPNQAYNVYRLKK